MALTQEEVKRMEEQDDLSDRFNRAADSYVAGNDPRLRAAEREKVLRQREGDVFAAARQRRLDSQRMTALSDPGRYAPQVYRDAKEWADKGGLRQHEIDIADKGIEQERVKAWGMANQGGVAAGIKAGAERDANRAQHGYFDENGNYVPGSTVHAAEATGLMKSELQENNWRNRNENTRIIEEGRDRRQQQQLDAGREKTDAWRQEKVLDRQANKDKASERTQRIRERQAQQDALREQRDFEAFDQKVGTMNLDLPPKQEAEYKALKTPEERKAWWKDHFGREAQQPDNGAPKNGDRKQFKQGWSTWKDGKWVLDAQ